MLFTGAPIALATGVYPDMNEDGDITKNIKTSDDINVNETGTYHINYSVTDSHGNTSTLEVPVTVEKDGTIFENGALTPAAKETGAPFIGYIIASVLLMMAIIIIIKKERIRIKSC